jgi:L-asparaginase II
MSEPLAKVYRNGLVEAVHRGSVAVVRDNGDLLYSVGDPYHVTYMRSAAKPLQALPIVESGAVERYGITERELATIVASHSGEVIHTEAVRSILEKIGLDEGDLQCGTHMPYADDVKKALIQKGKEPTPLYNNCSGKHAGMLLISRMKGYPLESYYEPDHPLQEEILVTMRYITAYEEIMRGTDGCGVPVFALPLYNMALAFSRLANPSDLSPSTKKAAERITHAMQRYPEQIGGTGRLDTDLMKATKKVIGKVGAEGVHCVGVLKKGIGIAVKIDDGNSRARGPVSIEILKELGILNNKELQLLEKHHTPLSKNCREEIVGKILPVVDLYSSKRESR